MATSVIIHVAGPHQHPKLLQEAMVLAEMLDQLLTLLKPYGRQSTDLALQIALPVHITSAQTSPESQAKKLINMHVSFLLQEHHPAHRPEDLFSRTDAPIDLGSSNKSV